MYVIISKVVQKFEVDNFSILPYSCDVSKSNIANQLNLVLNKQINTMFIV